MAIRKEILDELLKDYKNPENLTGKDGLLNELKKAIIERALEGELASTAGMKYIARENQQRKQPATARARNVSR